MDFTINMDNFVKKVDDETGSILFYKNRHKGLPDKVLNGDGYTIELLNSEVVCVDIYNSKKLISLILEMSDISEN